MLNKKGQIGETLTWLIATIIIVVVLIFFIFGASVLGSTKKVGNFKDSLFSESIFEGDDVFLKKSLFTYYTINKDYDREMILDDLVKWEKEGKFDLKLNETKMEISSRRNR
jgi:uncharacterized metal-binding protein